MTKSKRDELIDVMTGKINAIRIDMNPAWFNAMRANTPISDPYLRSRQDGEFEFMGVLIHQTVTVETYEVKEMVSATSDDRVVNNVARHEYRVLTDDEKELVGEIKDRCAELIQLLEHNMQLMSRDLRSHQLAIEHIEDASMRAVRAVTK